MSGRSYHKAAEHYSNAVAAARKPTGQGYRLSDLIWESANALGYAGGADDHLGVTLGELRAKRREAEAARRRARDLRRNAGETTGRAETAVRSVLEAKATLMPEERVLRTEYREIVGKAWRAAVEKVEKVIKVGKREGPAGRCGSRDALPIGTAPERARGRIVLLTLTSSPCSSMRRVNEDYLQPS